jgi:hypothetical protein
LFSNRFRLENENFHCLFSNPQAGEIFKLEEATLGNQNSKKLLSKASVNYSTARWSWMGTCLNTTKLLS